MVSKSNSLKHLFPKCFNGVFIRLLIAPDDIYKKFKKIFKKISEKKLVWSRVSNGWGI